MTLIWLIFADILRQSNDKSYLIFIVNRKSKTVNHF